MLNHGGSSTGGSRAMATRLGSFWLPFSRKLSGLRYLRRSHYGGDAITDLRRLFASRLIPVRIMRDCCQIEPLMRLNEVYRDSESVRVKPAKTALRPAITSFSSEPVPSYGFGVILGNSSALLIQGG